RARPHSPYALDVEPVAAAELELQPPEPALDALGAARHVVRVAEPDRPRRGRACPRQAQQPPDGDAEQLALPVVQGGVEGRLRCVLTRHLVQPRADLLERKGIVPQEGRMFADERLRRLGRLAVALDRSGLAAPDMVAVPDLDLDDVRPVR